MAKTMIDSSFFPKHERIKKVLLDTDVIIDFLRVGIDYKTVFKGIKNKETQAYISSITAFELNNGALLSDNPKLKLEEVSELTNMMGIVPFDKTESYVASKIYAYLVKKGLPLEIRDILISACAISNNIRILTKNKKHFSRIPELQFYD